jgi:hypothetical protein
VKKEKKNWAGSVTVVRKRAFLRFSSQKMMGSNKLFAYVSSQCGQERGKALQKKEVPTFFLLEQLT